MATALSSDIQPRLAHEPIKPHVASLVLNSKEELLAGSLGPQLRELLEERGVLVFPKIGFSHQEQVAFTKTLGTFAPERMDAGGEDVHKISLDPKVNPSGAEYLKGSLYWHIDGTMNDVPILRYSADLESARADLATSYPTQAAKLTVWAPTNGAKFACDGDEFTAYAIPTTPVASRP